MSAAIPLAASAAEGIARATVAASPAASSAGAPPASRTPVWIDCDPGHDDALALILAGHSSQLRILGVSTVAGNQSISKTTLNALRVLEVSGLGHVPVFEGSAKPIMRRAAECEEIHGESGLEGTRFPPLQGRAGRTKAFEAIRQAAEECMSAGTPLTLIATGPLTNVAALWITYPELFIPAAISSVVLMGGAVGVGNTGPAAEFNVEHDPEAAALVFEQAARTDGSAVPVVMVPLEVTHTALVTEEVLADIRSISGPNGQPSGFSTLICDLLLFFREAYTRVFGFSSPPLHDPCAVAYVLHPELFSTRRMRVDVDCASTLCAGRTVCDIYARSKHPPNVTVALAMDVRAFWALMIEALRKADKCSSINMEANAGSESGNSAPATTAAAPAASHGALLLEDADVSPFGPLPVRVQNLPPLTQSTDRAPVAGAQF